jgi:hypothetical protein
MSDSQRRSEFRPFAGRRFILMLSSAIFSASHPMRWMQPDRRATEGEVIAGADKRVSIRQATGSSTSFEPKVQKYFGPETPQEGLKPV